MTPKTQEDLLALVSTVDLIDALLARYDDAVFAGIQERKTGTKTDEGYRVVSRRFKGDLVGCIGIAFSLQYVCQRALEDEIEEMSEADL